MRCRYCFSHYEKDHAELAMSMPEQAQIKLIRELFTIGFRKISFAGGEPTLCRHLPRLVQFSKNIGFTTMLVTNSSRIDDALLRSFHGSLDWLCISIDSLKTSTNLEIGRCLSNGFVLCEDYYKQIIELAREHGLRLKINTVLSRFNLHENFTGFLLWAKPERWKVFQVLPVVGQNETAFNECSITEDEMSLFLTKHASLQKLFDIIPERNNDMKGSYVMVNPSGRFYCNINGQHTYSDQVLEAGAKMAIAQMSYDFAKFINRQGLYKW